MIKGYKFLINEKEKERIISLHENRTKTQYLIIEKDNKENFESQNDIKLEEKIKN